MARHPHLSGMSAADGGGSMSRTEGFAVMDVSTSICDDPKFRRIQRQTPDLVAPAFTAYVAVASESWKAGRRVAVVDAWPTFLPYVAEVVAALMDAKLIDHRGLIPVKAWRGWFEPARERRDKSRDRWARYNAKRDADTTLPPRGSDVDTTTSDPSVRPSGPSDRPSPSDGARGEKDDGLKPRTEEERRRELLLALSEDYKAGRITQLEYERQRRDVA